MKGKRYLHSDSSRVVCKALNQNVTEQKILRAPHCIGYFYAKVDLKKTTRPIVQ